MRNLARPMLCRVHRYSAVVLTALFVSLLVACGGGNSSSSASATIGTQGGTLVGPDGVSVAIPAGALEQPTVISITRTSAGAPDVLEAYPVAGNVYEFTPHDVSFNSLVTVSAPVPNGATGAELFMASPGGDWKQLDTQVANGVATWERNTFSYAYVAYPCLVPTAMLNDPYWCARERSYARIVATPPQALTQTSVPNIMTGDAGSYLLTQAASLQVTSTFGVPGNCRNVSVTLKHSLYDPVSYTWSPLQPFKSPLSPALTLSANGHLLEGTAPFTVASTELGNGKHRLSLIVDLECPRAAHAPNSSTVTGWDTGNYQARWVGDGMVVDVDVVPPAVSYTVGGSVNGLTGSGLVLQNNGTNFTPVAADGSFTFSNSVGAGAPYDVSVLTQPAGQTCTVNNGSGTANADINNVSVTCITTYSIGGAVSGLVGSGLVLQNNGADDLTFTNSGAFSFVTRLAAGAAYAVTVKTQPSGSNCIVQSGGTGTANADVTDVVVVCTSTGALALVANSGVTNGTNGLSVYRVSPTTGVMSFLANVNAGNTPYAIALSPNGLYAYVTNQVGGTVSSYSIDNVTGVVSPIPLSSPSSNNASGIAMDHLGRYIWVANYGFNTVSAFSIGAGGVLTAAGAPKATSSFPFAITAHPTADFVYVAHEMSNAITVYSVNTASGALTLLQTLSNAITVPRGFTIDPSGRFLYVTSANGGISAFAINATTGQLTTIGSVSSGSATNSVAVNPNGLYLYVVNRAAAPDNVLVFSINQTSGALTLLPTTYSAGNNPSSVAIDATGAYLYVTNLTSNDVSAFSIGGSGAILTSLGATVATGTAPEGIAVTP
ncbi:MAG: beta-propeller fold lactonase family protein [Gammaproteobacteria bacterium]|nr:beta-propeller fold lactonase family protein [Gammaproteobacteria bacterium]